MFFNFENIRAQSYDRSANNIIMSGKNHGIQSLISKERPFEHF